MYFLISAGVIWLFFTLIYLVALKVNNYSIVDMGWGPGFVVNAWGLAILLLIQGVNVSWLGWFVIAAITIWGVRLFWHIGRRNWGKPEDFRYQDMRRKWGAKDEKWKAYVWVFLLQGLLMWLISLAPIYAITTPVTMSLTYWIFISIGAVVFVFGLVFEAVGDAQLKAFITNPANKGQLMTRGLWSWTRHPNYFGEAVLWWGIALPAFLLPIGYVFVISPIVITYLVRYVSGVPLLERKYANREDFKSYTKKTSIFVPLPPKKEK